MAGVAQFGNSRDYLILEKATRAKAQSRQIVAQIDQIYQELEESDRGWPISDGQEVVMAHLLGRKGTHTGKAYQLEVKLDSFVAQMRQEYPKLEIPTLTNGTKKKFLAVSTNQYQNRDFAQYNFGNVSLAAALATLTNLQMKVLRIERQIVCHADQIADSPGSFSKIRAVAVPAARRVIAGSPYQARLFLGDELHNFEVQRTATFSEGKVDLAWWEAKVEFTAQASDYDQHGNAHQAWEADIRLRTAENGDTTWSIPTNYTVVKPTIVVGLDSGPQLYLGCANPVNVGAPELGAAFAPTFTATGAGLIMGKVPGELVLVPHAPLVELQVSNAGAWLSTERFRVVLIPRPLLKVVGLDLKLGGPCPASVTVVAQAEPSFAATLPQDARYQVAELEVTLLRANQALGRAKGAAIATLGTLRAHAREGDHLLIEVKKLQRINFQGRTEPVTMPAEQRVFHYWIGK
jgi:gliding motility-associated protein GldM